MRDNYPIEETEPWWPECKRRNRKPVAPDGLRDIVATASRLNVTTEKVRAFVRDGELKFINVGHGSKRPRYRFSDADINELIEKRKTQEIKPCPSSGLQSPRHTSGMGFKSVVVGFTAARDARIAEKRKNSKR